MSLTVGTATTQYLTYTLGDEVFAFDIAKVREVLDYPVVTHVPRMPDYMQGVINLRGTVVPVIDLRLKFGMPPSARTKDTCIIIAEAASDGETTVLGALADSVQEVLNLDPEHIDPAPKLGASLRTEFIRGMGRAGERFIMILDIDRLFSAADRVRAQPPQTAFTPPEAA